MRDDKERLEKILECIGRIREYTKVGRETFFASHLIRDGVVRNLQVIGECVKDLGEALKSSHSDIEWKQIARMRDKVTHDYFNVDYEIVWKVVEEDLEPFKKRIFDIHQRLMFKIPENRKSRLKEELEESDQDNGGD